MTYVTIRAGDRHEAFEYVLVQHALWILCRLIRHEAIDEGKRSLGDCHARERTICKAPLAKLQGSGYGTVLTIELWIFVDALLEAGLPKVSQHFQVIVRSRCIRLQAVKLFIPVSGSLMSWLGNTLHCLPP